MILGPRQRVIWRLAGRCKEWDVRMQRVEFRDFRPETDHAFFARTVVLVEGVSDQLALEALAGRRGRNLDAEGVSIVPIGGSKNIGSFLDLYGPQGFDIRLAGLCDAAEEGDFR